MASAFDILYSTVKDLAISRFEKPTLVQELAIPKVLEGKNVLVIAETGSGKTESVMLGLFSKLAEKQHEPIALLYLSPMKSLNRDMMDRLVWWCNKLDIDISVRHGDTTQYQRKLQVEHPPTIMISTPEQINAMLSGKRLRELLKKIKYIVIDEVHELVTSKRGVQLTLSLERLKRYCGKPQIIALSATVGSPKLAADFIFAGEKYEVLKTVNPRDLRITVESPYPTKEDRKIAENIFIGESVVSRLRRIYEEISKHKSALIFTNTREAAEVLSSRLRMLDEKFPHEIHHSSLSKDVRINAEKDFKAEKLKSLITTSSLELGIDIGSIDLIIQYMSPRQVSKITQRVGRSGHGIGRISEGIIIASEGDDLFESAVIARKALNGELEPLTLHSNSLDVLTHQIIGLLIENFEMDAKDIYSTFKKAYPYRNMKEDEFMNLVNFLTNQMRLVYIDGKVKRRRRAFKYYFENLSVIPDQRSYRVIDTATNTSVGSLDEEFIASHGSPGSTFIVRGRPWRILSVEKNKVFVDSINDIASAIPAWKGELIPVPYSISQEVGELRYDIAKLLKKKKDKEIVNELKKKYPITEQTAIKMIKIIKSHIKKYHIPSPKDIYFESFKEYVVMHCMFGTKVNETLSRFVTTILSATHGKFITSRCDPYRIIIRGCRIDEIKKVLFDYKPEEIKIILEKALSRSSLFKFRFIHVAKRFGAISRDANFATINLDKLIDVYWKTPIFHETLAELFTQKLDFEKTEEIIKGIQEKKIKLAHGDGLSPLGKMGFTYELQDVVKPNRPEGEIYKLFKKRLLDSKVKLICINCGKYSMTNYVKKIEKEPRCRKCQSKLIAIVKPYKIETQKIVKKWLKGGELTGEEREKLHFIKKSADLCIVYGKLACIVMAGRGIGPQTAFRILSKPRNKEEDLYKYILDAERTFIKNKKFWQ
ncbi:MAG: DEAD/DEAH box helicase [Candidatus Aenigmatarchaeota archaeon]